MQPQNIRPLAINSVIACRTLLLALLGREAPACGPGLLFAGCEPGLLADHASQFGLGAPADLRAAGQLLAHLGGYRDRQHDPHPGRQIMWHGYGTLTSATLGHQVASEGVRHRPLKDPEEGLVPLAESPHSWRPFFARRRQFPRRARFSASSAALE